MKLGDLVEFNTDYVRTGNSFDPDWIEDTAPQEVIDDMFDNGYELIKLKARHHETAKKGIIAGKRRYALSTHFEYVEEYSSDWKWAAIRQPTETFYMVACGLNSLYKVKECDLRREGSPYEFYEEKIEGLIDE